MTLPFLSLVLLAQQADPIIPNTYCVISSKTASIDLDVFALTKEHPAAESFRSGNGAYFVAIHPECIYVVDCESLGIQNLYNIANALVDVKNQRNPSAISEQLTIALTPMIWSPFRNKDIIQMSKLHFTPGYSMTLSTHAGAERRLEYREPFSMPTDAGLHEISINWQQIHASTRFSLNNVSLSVGGTSSPSSHTVRKILEKAVAVAWEDYESARIKYNDAMIILRQSFQNGYLPFFVDKSIEGKQLKDLPPSYNSLYLQLLDLNDPNKNWETAKIDSASIEMYVRGQLGLRNGQVESFTFQLPYEIK